MGGVVAGLAEVTRWILTHAKHASTIALHFDHEDALLDWTGPAEPGELSVLRVRSARRVRILLAEWANAGAILSDLRPRNIPAPVDEAWLQLDTLPENGDIVIDMRSPITRERMNFRDTDLEVRSHGYFVTGMTAPGKRLRFFDEL